MTKHPACTNCGELIDPAWTNCPYCGACRTGAEAEWVRPEVNILVSKIFDTSNMDELKKRIWGAVNDHRTGSMPYQSTVGYLINVMDQRAIDSRLDELELVKSASPGFDFPGRIAELEEKKRKLGDGTTRLRSGIKQGLQSAPAYFVIWGGLGWAAMRFGRMFGIPAASIIGVVIAVNFVTEYFHIRSHFDTPSKGLVDFISKSLLPAIAFAAKIV